MAKEINIFLRGGQRLSLSHADLPLHEIKPRDAFCHRVLNLQPGIHLQKIKLATGIEQKLHCAGAHVAHRPRRLYCSGTHRFAQLWRHDGARRFLYDLLVPPLQRAVTLTQMNHIAMSIGKHLHLDVPRTLDCSFQNEVTVAKGTFSLGTRQRDRLQQLIRVSNTPHTATAAPCRGLDHDGHPHRFRLAAECVVGLVLALISGDAGHLGLQHGAFCERLITHDFYGRRGRADKDDACLCTSRRKTGVLT